MSPPHAPRTPAAPAAPAAPTSPARAAALAAVGALAGAVPPLASLAVRTLTSRRAAPGDPVDAVVVLGSRLDAGRVPPELAARLERAAALAGGAPPLVVSGAAAPGSRVSEAAAMAAALARLGVPGERVLVEDAARTTVENLRRSAELLRSRGLPAGRLVVVTSDYHVARVRRVARRTGVPARVVGARTPRPQLGPALRREARLLLGQRALGVLARGLLAPAALLLARRLAGRLAAGSPPL